MILLVPNAAVANQIQQQSRAWVVRPSKGLGEVTVRVVIAPDPNMTRDEAWIMTQMVELGLARPEDISQATLLFWPKEQP